MCFSSSFDNLQIGQEISFFCLRILAAEAEGTSDRTNLW